MATLPVPALAQTETAPDESALDGDYLLVGAGIVYGPSYDGSNDEVVSPFPLLQGRLKGIEINPRPTTSYCALQRRSPVNLAQLSLDLLAGGKPANPNWPPHQESYNSEGSAEEAMNPATSMETAS